MFDISFAELMLIAVVALLVVGPDKLPKVARTMGVYTGRLQRYISQVKEEVNREARFEELKALQQEIKQGVGSVTSSIRDNVNVGQDALSSVEKTIKSKPRAKRKPTVAKAAAKKVSVNKSPVKKPRVKKPTAGKVSATKSVTVRKPIAKKAVTKQKNKAAKR
ncbi:MAG: Sec-independent protein translocase protein TatB [Methylophilaceae bacterium]